VLCDRMTLPRRAVALAALSGPVVIVLLLLIGIAAGAERLTALIVLIYLFLVALAGAVLVLRWRRRRARTLDAYAFHGVIAGPARAALGPQSMMPSPALTSLRIAAGLHSFSLPALFAFGAATRTNLARDILAARATAFRTDGDGLVAALAAASSTDDLRRALGPVDLPVFIAFLRVLAGSADDPVSQLALRNGALLAGGHPDTLVLRPDDRRILVERLLLAEEPAAAARVLEATGSLAAPEWLLGLDTLHPDRNGAAAGDEVLWLTALNALYFRSGLEPLRLSGHGPTRLDRLIADTVAAVDEGPTISIIMTCYHPGVELETAVRSVIAQSWQRWELIIADDASGNKYELVLERIASLDGRIRVLRAPENRGTYVRRNDALAAAVGEFVTMHDSDDWAHPRRLEQQAHHLMSRPALLANLSRSIRATDALRVAQPRGTLLRLTETSLLFRREQVIERIGWFDAVRKAADTGFRLRIEAISGSPVPVIDVEAPLSVVRFSRGSLSGAELGDGWMHPARVAYASAHSHWLARESAAGRAGYLEQNPDSRAFPAPAVLLGQSVVTRDIDLLVVVDVRANEKMAARDRHGDRALAEWCESGLRVGIMRSDSIAPLPLPHTARSAVQELINEGTAIEVLHGEHVSARLVIALRSECLLGLPPSAPSISSTELILIDDDHREQPGVLNNASLLRPEIDRAASRLAPDAVAQSLRIDGASAAVRALLAADLADEAR